MAKKKLEIIKIIKKTVGGFHSWVKARTKDGKIIVVRKENKNINLKK